MRIAMYAMTKIKNKILIDLYGEPEKALNTRRSEIAKRNREYYLEPLKPIFSKLPLEMITQHKEYHLKIRYQINKEDDLNSVSETWNYISNTPITNPHDAFLSYGILSVPNNILDVRLQQVTAKLCNDIIALRKEKNKMAEFLSKTTDQYSGSLQLRAVWPEILHHYLPSEPIREKDSKIKETVPVFITPIDLKVRLTTNLLERS